MELNHGFHLGYCTNIHPGESWAETLANLEQHTLAVRERVCPGRRYAIGLRLGEAAARELSQPKTLLEFRHWLDRHDAYVFTINGFPYGRFHGTRVKEQVYAPDWTTSERLDYTIRLFELLAQLVPEGIEGSVSTVPGSFKEFIRTDEQVAAMRRNLWTCVEHVAALSGRCGRKLHLGLEPEPLCFLETSDEAVRFFDQMRDDRPCDHRIDHHLGLNYDTCHLAVEFEEPAVAINHLRRNGVLLSKVHLSSALKLRPTPAARERLASFADDTYFHQVIVRREDGRLERIRDLPDALRQGPADDSGEGEEWRVHFHIPLHAAPAFPLGGTTDHLLGVLDLLTAEPRLCRHFEMETYTWGVMPPELRQASVVDQLVGEYEWTLARFAERGIRSAD
ncbi:MAG: metabolite traffic protein EboE [Limisphaerales bacterium]